MTRTSLFAFPLESNDSCVSSPDQVRGARQTTGQRFRWVSPSSQRRIAASSRPGGSAGRASRSLADAKRHTRIHLPLAVVA